MRPVLGRLIRGVVILLLLTVAVAAGGLVWMHLVVERERGPLPLVNELLDVANASDLPTKVSVIETAQQRSVGGGISHARNLAAGASPARRGG